MKRSFSIFLLVLSFGSLSAQTDPIITSWLQNTTGLTGSHYMSGNTTAIVDNVEANIQLVQYSNDWIYATTNGIPAYTTGPFLDGNPSIATDQNAIFKISRNPVQNNGAPIPTTGGNIGVFVNGVALFDYRDGVSWNFANNALAGGPTGGMGDHVWNRDAVVGERGGFDCSKAHPAMGNYHHHQNPSAFSLDLAVISNVCDLYPADGLYAIDETQHSPLLGFAYDGFPIYGAYAYKNADGTGGIERMKSGYELRNITVRTVYADGSDVTDGPPVSTTYPLGYFREDYEFVAPVSEDYLDEHNGRFCITPEFPGGIYCYFTTVNATWNSAYPYVVGPAFYGTKTAAKVTTISEPVTTYTAIPTGLSVNNNSGQLSVYPNPANDFIAVQVKSVLKADMVVRVYDSKGAEVSSFPIKQGSTIGYIDVKALKNGVYFLRSDSDKAFNQKIVIGK